jgi:5-methyltetrahydropteroyltriglutamate--homocysteine methyltransferase
MNIPTEPIGSIPRPLWLIDAVKACDDGTDPSLDDRYEEATRDTIEQFEATGSPVITDGEQRKYHNFWTYSVHGLKNTSPGRLQNPVCCRSYAANAAPDGRAFPLQALRGSVS